MSTVGRTRAGGRAGRIQTRAAHTGESHAPPFIRRQIPCYELLGEEGLDLIEENADRILAEVGIELRGDEVALALFRDAGATVDGERVRFDPGHVRSLCATAPRSFTQRARNPDRSVEIGGDAVVLAPAYGSPFVRDMRRRTPVRVAGRLRELREARLRHAVAPPLGRDRVRAGRRAGQQAAPRHGLRAPSLQRQGTDGVGHPAVPRRRLHRDGARRLRSRRRRPGVRDPRQRQRELAARVGCDHDRCPAGVRVGQPGAGGGPVHPRRAPWVR